MKYNLGSKPDPAPVAMESRVWYPSVSLRVPTMPKFKVGDAITGDVVGIVRGVSKDPQSGQFCCDIELHEIEIEREKSGVEKAGY